MKYLQEYLMSWCYRINIVWKNRQEIILIQCLITELPICVYRETGVIVYGGIEILGAKAISISHRKAIADSVIEGCKFIAYHDYADISLGEAIRGSMQLQNGVRRLSNR